MPLLLLLLLLVDRSGRHGPPDNGSEETTGNLFSRSLKGLLGGASAKLFGSMAQRNQSVR